MLDSFKKKKSKNLGSFLQILCWLHFYLSSFSYTSHDGVIFLWAVSITHPMMGSFSYTSRAVLFSFFFFSSFFFLFPFYLGNFSYTSHVCFISLWGVSLTRPLLVSFSFLNLVSFSSTSYAGFIFYVGSFLIHPVLASFLSGGGVSLLHPMLVTFWSSEFLLHIPCWLHYYLGRLS